MSLSLSKQDARDIILSREYEFWVRGSRNETNESSFIERIFDGDVFRFDVAVNERGPFAPWCFWDSRRLTADSTVECARFRSRPSTGTFDFLSGGQAAIRDGNDLCLHLYERFKEGVFRFRAERSRALSGIVAPGTELAADASNLVQILDNLQARHTKFQAYLGYVRRVLPEIQSLGVTAIDNNNKAIKIWFFDGEREDFAIPLGDAGSGVPNILAQLYTITMSSRPRLIMIDEPNVFLHPGATRELMRIVREFPIHQYIISSHQPIALDELDNVGIALLQRGHDGATSVQSIDPERSQDLQTVLATVGASLSDVFSADRVLWVEGMTETRAFRTVAAWIGLPRGAAILPIVHTGDLEGPGATLAVEIYRRLTESAALLPPAIAVVLDDEGRSDAEKSELRTVLHGTRVEFLPVRMIENLFLDSKLISAFLQKEEDRWGPATVDYSPDKISTFWDGLQGAHRYKTTHRRREDEKQWSRAIHGARVLEDTFAHFTENRLAFNKVDHGVRLTRLASELNPPLLEPIKVLLQDLLTANK